MFVREDDLLWFGAHLLKCIFLCVRLVCKSMGTSCKTVTTVYNLCTLICLITDLHMSHMCSPLKKYTRVQF